ncbi:MAG: hypothetical protein HQL73_08255 [Magnetococcales bacterium]|nr:hypothetical protein [Magnetococcales bacterium]
MKQLDRSRPYGEVHGAHGVAFVQEGCCFDLQGRETKSQRPPTWDALVLDPQLAQQELTRRAAATTIKELSSLPLAEVKRIARNEYHLHTGRSSKEVLLQNIYNRIMEQA